jgi:pantoate--beta-alanine ligase
MTSIVETLEAWTSYRRDLRGSGRTIGFVPTMGALHEGHGELIRQARIETDFVVVSVFLNPTQFNNPNDFSKYPKTLDHDRSLASDAGADVIFAPRNEMLYPDDYRYKLTETDFSKNLEGEHRPGHFDGVLSVVMKLFNLVQPDRAYFGEKDFQQLKLIEGMVDAFFMDIKIVGVPTVREPDGLAMSSRNALLSSDGRKKASVFYQTLVQTPTPAEVSAKLKLEGFAVEYVEDFEDRRLGAVVIDNVRLIDNVSIKNTI